MYQNQHQYSFSKIIYMKTYGIDRREQHEKKKDRMNMCEKKKEIKRGKTKCLRVICMNSDQEWIVWFFKPVYERIDDWNMWLALILVLGDLDTFQGIDKPIVDQLIQ